MLERSKTDRWLGALRTVSKGQLHCLNDQLISAAEQLHCLAL